MTFTRFDLSFNNFNNPNINVYFNETQAILVLIFS